MRVLVACEFSGVVRRAFAARGHFVVSVDLIPAEDGAKFAMPRSGIGQHYIGSVEDFLLMGTTGEMPGDWDMLIAFPPCTHLAVSGARWFAGKRAEQADALQFVRALLDAPIPRIALENPISVISTRIRKPDQIIQPWQFGHGETKATCLWLKGLPLLQPTHIVSGRTARVHRIAPGPDRWKERSRTLPGIAQAMAEQWA